MIKSQGEYPSGYFFILMIELFSLAAGTSGPEQPRGLIWESSIKPRGRLRCYSANLLLALGPCLMGQGSWCHYVSTACL